MPNKRIPPSLAISKEIMYITQHLDQQGSNQRLLGKLLQLSMRKLIQELLEKEVLEHIGRAYYEHGPYGAGYRNGYKQSYLKTAENRLPILKPQVCDGPVGFRSSIWPHIKGRTDELERIAVEMYARGCSTRDIEELLKDEYGRILLSKSSISKLNQRLWEEYESFCKADLSEYDVVYIFCDAVYESLRLYKSRKEGILVVWGILSSGVKILLGMTLGNKESHEDWALAFRSLKKRGLTEPVLGVSDGAPGLIQAFEEAFPHTLRQRCLVHKKRNILGKFPSNTSAEAKIYLNRIYYAPDKEAAYREAKIFKDKFAWRYPSAVMCLDDDFDACISYLECPIEHRRYITSTNLIERSFLEQKRRSKVIPRFFDERSGLKLAFASLIRASRNWRKINIAFDEQIKLMELRQKLGQAAKKERTIPKNQRVSYEKFSSKKKT